MVSTLVPSGASKRGHKTKKHILIGSLPDMTCFAVKHLNFDSRQSKLSCQRLSCLHVFDQHILLIFFYLPNFFLMPWIFCWSKTNQADKQLPTFHMNIRIKPPQTSTVWWQNMSSPHIIRTHFFVTCTRLDATDSIWTWATLVRGECCHHCSLLKGWQVGFFIPFKTTTET